MIDYSAKRASMVQRLAQRGIRDPRVLEAMRQVPREEFVDTPLRAQSYDDMSLTNGDQRSFTQPQIVALMVETAGIAPGDRALMIGAGHGYLAAIMAEISWQVFAIEGDPVVATRTAERFDRLGYSNIQLGTREGRMGWAEAGPFDAIVALIPADPAPLWHQLRIGGRLVMPVDDASGLAHVVRLIRTSEDSVIRDEFGELPALDPAQRVEPEPEPEPDAPMAADAPVDLAARRALPRAGDRAARARLRRATLVEQVRQAAEPLPDVDDPVFAAHFDRFADARVVLLGEASHGTSEFYRARAAITRRLIELHGFHFVAVEADWPDAAEVDRDVRGLPPRDDAEPPFQRFPTWMWRNTDVDAFVGWLRGHNAGVDEEHRAGFHGLDLYSLGRSMRAVIDYLDDIDPATARLARERYGCMTPWTHDPAGYGRMALASGHARCEPGVVAMLRELMDRQFEYRARDGADFLDAAQNARLVRNAEQYYRAMYRGAAESWNLRDRHMFETLAQLLQSRGPASKAVVWAHNSHIGDARHTEMGQVRGELNLGQLCRERFGEAAALIGFGTHGGTVAAADNWDEPMKVMVVNPSLSGSYEEISHEAGPERLLLDLRPGHHPVLQEALCDPRLERYIGVIYRPHTERWSHYSPAMLPRQFDAWVWFDHTTAVTPLPTQERHDGTLDTYPFGL